MKVRTDFVSNSSSSSYVLSVDFGRYGFSDFVETVCRNCDDPDNEYHDPKNYERNAAVLGYCAQNYELLFLGHLCKGRKRKVYRRGYNWDDVYDGKDDDDSPFQCAVRNMEHRAAGHGWDRDGYTSWYDGPDTVVCEWDDLDENNVTISGSDMNYIRSTELAGPVTGGEFDGGGRVARILEYVDLHVRKPARKPRSCVASTYKITMDTIRNTKDLLAAGVDLRLDDPETVNKFEARLRAGEEVLYVECGAEGEGGGDTWIYSETGTYCMENVPAEFVELDY